MTCSSSGAALLSLKLKRETCFGYGAPNQLNSNLNLGQDKAVEDDFVKNVFYLYVN